MSLAFPEHTLGLRHPDFEPEEYWAEYNQAISLADLGFHCAGSCYQDLRSMIISSLPAYEQVCADAQRWSHYAPSMVSIPRDLHPVQPTVNSLVVDYYLDGGMPHQDVLNQTPVFASIFGKTYLWNGTHRVVSAMRRGEDSVWARWVDFDALAR